MEGDLLRPYLMAMVEFAHDGRTLDPLAPRPSHFSLDLGRSYFCAGDQTGESLTVLALTVLAGLRVSLCCPLPSAFMT